MENSEATLNKIKEASKRKIRKTLAL